MLTTLLATCAATLLESTPFVLAALLLSKAFRRRAWIVPFLGCGCGSGPSARSLPAMAAACIIFGPAVAGARLFAAIVVSRFAKRASPRESDSGEPLQQLFALLPAGLGAACAAPFAPVLFGMHPPPVPAFLAGAAAGFVAAPCALGTVAVAASLAHAIPAAAAGMLCVAGIADGRVWLRFAHAHREKHDVFAYVLGAAACANVAAHGGGGLVHPKIAFCLWFCSALFAWLAFAHRGRRRAVLRIAPVIMLAGSIVAAPPPQYQATETTLENAFAGERIDFTGALVRSGSAASIVRYAITCCRADAAPVAIRLSRVPSSLRGWIRARGTLVEGGSGLALQAARIDRIDPPADPFIYR